MSEFKIIVPPGTHKLANDQGMTLPKYFAEYTRFGSYIAPQATTEGVEEVLRKLWKEQP